MRFKKICIVIIGMIIANYSYGLSRTTFSNLTVGPPGEKDFNDRTAYADEYVRSPNNSIAYRMIIQQTQLSRVEENEYWNASLWDITTGLKVEDLSKVKAVARNIAGTDKMCLTNDNPTGNPTTSLTVCFSVDWPVGVSWEAISFTEILNMNCSDPSNYEIRIEHMQGYQVDDFLLGDFKIGDPRITGVSNIKPELVIQRPQSSSTLATAPETFTAQVQILDSGGCGIPQENVDVTFTTSIVDSSGSHLHTFEGGDYGTGTFTGNDAYSYTMTTGADGRAEATYTAGIFGITETLLVEADGQDRGQTEKAEDFDIKVNGFVEITPQNGLTLLGGNSTCDNTHNDSSVDRRSHYVTPSTLTQMHSLNHLIQTHPLLNGRTLCVNDASLEFGGFFDNGNGTREYSRGSLNYCHGGHRTGTGFDLNSGCGQDSTVQGGIHNATVTINNAPMNIVDIYTDLANTLNGERVPEGPIHYEF